MKIKIIW